MHHVVTGEPLWYADDPNAPCREGKGCSVRLEKFIEEVTALFTNTPIVKTEYDRSMDYHLYRHSSMGHNVVTRLGIRCNGNIIQTISVKSYDQRPVLEDSGELYYELKDSEWINDLQILQIIDYLNLICGTDKRYVYMECKERQQNGND